MSGDYTTVVLDNKADTNELLASCLAANNRRKKPLPVYCITPSLGKKSHPFNVFLEDWFQALGPQGQADFLALVSDTEQPGGGDKRFYSDSNTLALKEVLARSKPLDYRCLNSELLRFAKGGKQSPTPLPDTLRKTSQHSYASFTRFNDIACLNAPTTFGLTRACQEPSILFFRDPIMELGQTGRMFGRLAMWGVVKAMIYLGIGKRVRCRLFVDELAQMVSPNLDTLYQQARGTGVSIVATYHGKKDLIKQGFDLATSVEINSRVRWYFTVPDAESQIRLSKSAGEMLDTMETETKSLTDNSMIPGVSFTESLGKQEVILPRLSINDIKLANDAPDKSILEITRGSGWAQFGGFPFVLRTQYHISKDEYESRRRIPWPDLPGMEMNEPPPTQAPAEAKPITTIDERPKKRRF